MTAIPALRSRHGRWGAPYRPLQLPATRLVGGIRRMLDPAQAHDLVPERFTLARGVDEDAGRKARRDEAGRSLRAVWRDSQLATVPEGTPSRRPISAWV
jgi:hypothetical protein